MAWVKNRIISLCEKIKKADHDFDYEINVKLEVDPALVPNYTEIVKAFQVCR